MKQIFVKIGSGIVAAAALIASGFAIAYVFFRDQKKPELVPDFKITSIKDADKIKYPTDGKHEARLGEIEKNTKKALGETK